MTNQTTQSVSIFARQPDHAVEPLFVRRWSPRAFQSTPVLRSSLESMVEAARWAPSSANLQPWQFHISDKQDATRSAWNEAVGAGNRVWSDKAPVLVWVVARKSMGPNPWSPPETPNRHAWFDTGAAAMQFVLQGERLGLSSHYMGGIDAAKAHAILGLDADHDVIAAIAVGHAADPHTLPEPLRAREVPSTRKPARDIARFA